MNQYIFILEIVGTIAFAISGALVAMKSKMDFFGVVIIGVITATFGGIMRDIVSVSYTHLEVISIKDHKGLSLKDEQSSKVPYFIELGINQSDIDYLSLASSLGEVRLFPSKNSYQPDKSTLELDSKVTEFLKILQQ